MTQQRAPFLTKDMINQAESESRQDDLALSAQLDALEKTLVLNRNHMTPIEYINWLGREKTWYTERLRTRLAAHLEDLNPADVGWITSLRAAFLRRIKLELELIKRAAEAALASTLQ